VITVGANGTISSAFTVMTGTVGPPVSGVDSAGNQASADAAKYLCPSDVTTGAGCTIGFGDSPTQNLAVPITFIPNNPGTPTSPTGGSSATTAAPGAVRSVTKSSSKALAFTGTGSDLRWMGAGGVGALVLGLILLALADRPRRLVNQISRQDLHSRPS
jgi:hypothetical protein